MNLGFSDEGPRLKCCISNKLNNDSLQALNLVSFPYASLYQS